MGSSSRRAREGREARERKTSREPRGNFERHARQARITRRTGADERGAAARIGQPVQRSNHRGADRTSRPFSVGANLDNDTYYPELGRTQILAAFGAEREDAALHDRPSDTRNAYDRMRAEKAEKERDDIRSEHLRGREMKKHLDAVAAALHNWPEDTRNAYAPEQLAPMIVMLRSSEASLKVENVSLREVTDTFSSERRNAIEELRTERDLWQHEREKLHRECRRLESGWDATASKTKALTEELARVENLLGLYDDHQQRYEQWLCDDGPEGYDDILLEAWTYCILAKGARDVADTQSAELEALRRVVSKAIRDLDVLERDPDMLTAHAVRRRNESIANAMRGALAALHAKPAPAASVHETPTDTAERERQRKAEKTPVFKVGDIVRVTRKESKQFGSIGVVDYADQHESSCLYWVNGTGFQEDGLALAPDDDPPPKALINVDPLVRRWIAWLFRQQEAMREELRVKKEGERR